ncbi:hypothetical protein TTHERM_000377291 (macronuclear) [Tetrahymena thermophila SB210]|uniref:Uncharacterized protein n=1 Tax=Tetrahymena thermophila (strain SB210) TaxID=312017 RepID=W7XAV2_TETTS|nr:hypothetical protein TTHERM_000377291 [Tetrahymena thermophila SB210]EWS74477.1 hypothetical protein TTHERM_000377291 [Tetrahymena thermophila SB210]|eukprot:XP_012652962.1 hypothetical protein TTHERM_000377291 [Tetrahymena thermophila SB210]
MMTYFILYRTVPRQNNQKLTSQKRIYKKRIVKQLSNTYHLLNLQRNLKYLFNLQITKSQRAFLNKLKDQVILNNLIQRFIAHLIILKFQQMDQCKINQQKSCLSYILIFLKKKIKSLLFLIIKKIIFINLPKSFSR